MVTDALKKVREILAYGLLAVAALYLLSGLSLLFKSNQDVGLDFAGKGAAFGNLFASPVLVFSLVAAVALVIGFGDVSKNARIVVLVALAIAGLAFLLALLSWFAGFGFDGSGFGGFGGVLGAGKVVGLLLGLAQLLLLGLVAWFAFTALKALPKTSNAGSSSSWAQPSAYGAQPGYGQPSWGQPQQGGGYPAGQQGWSQPQQSGQGWGQSPPGAGGATAAGGWGDSGQVRPEQQGQPASAWGSPEASYPSPERQQSGWGSAQQPGQQSGQQSAGWGSPESGSPQQPWGGPSLAGGAPSGPAGASRSEQWAGGPARPSAREAARTEQGQAAPVQRDTEPSSEDEERPRQSGWWQGPAQ